MKIAGNFTLNRMEDYSIYPLVHSLILTRQLERPKALANTASHVQILTADLLILTPPLLKLPCPGLAHVLNQARLRVILIDFSQNLKSNAGLIFQLSLHFVRPYNFQ
jgi:hypothetical protein